MTRAAAERAHDLLDRREGAQGLRVPGPRHEPRGVDPPQLLQGQPGPLQSLLLGDRAAVDGAEEVVEEALACGGVVEDFADRVAKKMGSHEGALLFEVINRTASAHFVGGIPIGERAEIGAVRCDQGDLEEGHPGDDRRRGGPMSNVRTRTTRRGFLYVGAAVAATGLLPRPRR